MLSGLEYKCTGGNYDLKTLWLKLWPKEKGNARKWLLVFPLFRLDRLLLDRSSFMMLRRAVNKRTLR